MMRFAAVVLFVFLLSEAASASNIERISIASDGDPALSGGDWARFSGDGRFVAFLSFTNLVASDTNNRPDIYVKDRQSGFLTLVSGSLNEDLLETRPPDISFDGDVVVFLYFGQVYRYQVSTDTLLNVSSQASVTAIGGDTNFTVSTRVSDDGRYVAFAASNRFSTFPCCSGETYNVYVYDSQTATAEVASVGDIVSSDPSFTAGAVEFELSATGRQVVFTAYRDNLSDLDNNNLPDIYVRNLDENTTTLVSFDIDGQFFQFGATQPDISDDGSTVTFIGNRLSGQDRVMAVSIPTLQSQVVNRSTCGVEGLSALTPKLSGNGRFVVFGNTGEIHDLQTGETRNHGARSSLDNSLVTFSYATQGVSDNGQQLLFNAFVDGVVPDDNNGISDVFVHTNLAIPYSETDPTTFELADRRFEMLSLPCPMPSGTTVDDLFGDDIPGDYGSSWVVFTYDPSGSPEYTDITANGVLEPGQGFWILQISGSSVTLDLPASDSDIAVNATEVCSSVLNCRSVPLSDLASGDTNDALWNLTGNPFPYSDGISYDNLRVSTQSGACAAPTGCTPEQADIGTGNVMFGNFYQYDSNVPGGYQILHGGETLAPWQAYWIGSLDAAGNNQPELHWPFKD